MAIVILGRAWDPDPSLPEKVVVPNDTVLRWVTGRHQVLLGPQELPLWEQPEATAVFGPGHDLPNLALGAFLEGGEQDDPQPTGTIVVLPGYGCEDLVHLCTDSRGACPTTSEQALGGIRHTCDGVLGRHPGEDVVWIECEEFTFTERQALAEWAARACAETVVSSAVRARAAAVLRTDSGRAGLGGALRDRARDVLEVDPQEFADHVLARVRRWRAEGRDADAAVVLRDQVYAPLLAALGACLRSAVEAGVEEQVWGLSAGELRPLAAEVMELSSSKGAPCDASQAESALRAAVDARVGGERPDLRDEDVAAVEESVRDVVDELSQELLGEAVYQLTELIALAEAAAEATEPGEYVYFSEAAPAA